MGSTYNEDTPFLQIHINPGGEDLPPSVFREILTYLAMMAPDEAYMVGTATKNPDGTTTFPGSPTNMEWVASGFEESTITIGHTPEEEKELVEYYEGDHSFDGWKNVWGGRPVAHWRSGLSSGCDQELFLMPDGTFQWTEP